MPGPPARRRDASAAQSRGFAADVRLIGWSSPRATGDGGRDEQHVQVTGDATADEPRAADHGPEARGRRHARSRTSTGPRSSTRGSGGGSTPTSPFDNGFRVVQLTPPGSGCSVQFGTNITSAAPGSAQGLYLIVSRHRGGPRRAASATAPTVSEVFHAADAGRPVPARRQRAGGSAGAGAATTRATARSPRSATRTATAGCSRRSPRGCPAGSTRPRRRTPRRRTWRARFGARRRAHGEHEERTGAAGRELAGLVRRVHGGGADRRGAADVTPTTTSSSSAAARRASTAPVRSPRAACASPWSSASWSAASAPTGPASRPRRCCVPARRCTAAREAAATRRGRRRGGAGLARLHGLGLLRRRAGALARRTRASTLLRGHRPAGRAGRRRGGRRPPHRRPRRGRDRLGPGRPAGPRPARARRASGPTAR